MRTSRAKRLLFWIGAWLVVCSCAENRPQADPCAAVACSGRGFCLAQDGIAYCACLPGFLSSGTDCVADDPIYPCRGVECNDGGSCVVLGGGEVTCDCWPGYEHPADPAICEVARCDLLCLPVARSDGDADADGGGETGDGDVGADAPDDGSSAEGCLIPTTPQQLHDLSWTIEPVLRRSDVTPPATGMTVDSIYSPTYAVFAGRERLAFGVALRCSVAGELAYKDSIGWAEREADRWTFRGYLLEPDPPVCAVPSSDWPVDTIHQVNDPEFLVDGDVLRMLYTSARKTADRLNCGSIGIAAFGADMSLLHRNDELVRSDAATWCLPPAGPPSGFSRPSLQFADGTARVWLDSDGVVWSFPLLALDVHPPPDLRHELGDYAVPNSGALDVEYFGGYGDGREMLLFNGTGVQAIGRSSVYRRWPSESRLSVLDQTIPGYRSVYGSPNLSFDPATCRLRLDFSAVLEEASGASQDLFAAVAAAHRP